MRPLICDGIRHVSPGKTQPLWTTRKAEAPAYCADEIFVCSHTVARDLSSSATASGSTADPAVRQPGSARWRAIRPPRCGFAIGRCPETETARDVGHCGARASPTQSTATTSRPQPRPPIRSIGRRRTIRSTRSSRTTRRSRSTAQSSSSRSTAQTQLTRATGSIEGDRRAAPYSFS